MPERNERQNLKIYREHKLTPEKATLMSATIGLFYGVISYGITHLAGDGELAEKVGIGVGGGLASASAGLYFGIEAQIRSQELAIQGEPRKAMFKMAQSSAKAAIGFGVSGAVTAYEATGVKGAVAGGVIGTLVGATGFARSAKELHASGQAYRDLIIPTQDPRNFPQYRVIKSELFKEEDILSLYPPVYQAATLSDMKGFRQAQVDHVTKKSSSLSGIFRAPEISLGRMTSALFIIPGISHYPAFDPEFDFALFGKIKESSLSVQLSDQEDNLIANPYRESKKVWPNSTEFLPFQSFREEQWKYWRNRSWKHGAIILAERKVNGWDKTSDSPKLIVEESYYLIDIIVDQSDKTRRKDDEKEQEKLRGLIPSPNPSGF